MNLRIAAILLLTLYAPTRIKKLEQEEVKYLYSSLSLSEVLS